MGQGKLDPIAVIYLEIQYTIHLFLLMNGIRQTDERPDQDSGKQDYGAFPFAIFARCKPLL